jgi:ParB/RepB/Spo0J family partition protein
MNATKEKELVSFIRIEELHPSKTNPRKNFRADELDDLSKSVAQHGILQPILVRPILAGGSIPGTGFPTFEIVAGERRYRAAKMANLDKIPCIVKELDNDVVIEIQIVENLQRHDLHALEEADGFRQLIRTKRYDAAKIADRIGRSVDFVYNRIKLLDLIDELKTDFHQDKITAAHAIILSRISVEAQKRARREGLYESEGGLFGPDKETSYGGGQKTRSVKELQAWVDTHVRFEAEKADSFLFPETVQSVKTATEQAAKIISITHEHFVRPEAKNDDRVYGPQSWRRADGKKGSKVCDHSVLGVFVVGPERGKSLQVCVSKDKCKTHYAKFQRERVERKKSSAAGSDKAAERQKKADEKRAEEEKKKEQLRANWKKAMPAILDALAAAIKKQPTGTGSEIGELVFRECLPHGGGTLAKMADKVKSGKNAEDVVRMAAFVILADLAGEWNAHNEFPKIVKPLGLDLKKIMAAVPATK